MIQNAASCDNCEQITPLPREYDSGQDELAAQGWYTIHAPDDEDEIAEDIELCSLSCLITWATSRDPLLAVGDPHTGTQPNVR